MPPNQPTDRTLLVKGRLDGEKEDWQVAKYGHRQGHPSHGGNEAEIFIIAILGGQIGFCHFRSKEISVHERLGDVLGGNVHI